MQQIELELAGGGVLTVSLRASLDAMPAVKERPLVLVVPGGGYSHVSPREGDPVALQFAAAGYHTAVLTYSVSEKSVTKGEALGMKMALFAAGALTEGIVLPSVIRMVAMLSK